MARNQLFGDGLPPEFEGKVKGYVENLKSEIIEVVTRRIAEVPPEQITAHVREVVREEVKRAADRLRGEVKAEFDGSIAGAASGFVVDLLGSMRKHPLLWIGGAVTAVLTFYGGVRLIRYRYPILDNPSPRHGSVAGGAREFADAVRALIGAGMSVQEAQVMARRFLSETPRHGIVDYSQPPASVLPGAEHTADIFGAHRRPD